MIKRCRHCWRRLEDHAATSLACPTGEASPKFSAQTFEPASAIDEVFSPERMEGRRNQVREEHRMGLDG